MKKIIISIMILVCGCTFLSGCGKEEKTEEKVLGGWETTINESNIMLDDNILTIFNKAKANYTSLEFEPIALLGRQVVAGTNYMFLAKGYQKGEEDNAKYKIVIVYNNLENVSQITQVNDFDYTKYVNENIDANNENLAGGWNVNAPGKPGMLDEKTQSIFDDATSTLAGMSFNPIVLVGKQLVSGTNYAVLCYGKASYQDAKESIYLITLYEDLNGTKELISSAYVNLADYNK